MKFIKKLLLIAGSLFLSFGAANVAQEAIKTEATETVTYERIKYLETGGDAYFNTQFKITNEDFRVEIMALCNDDSGTSNILFSLNNRTDNSFWCGSKDGRWAVGVNSSEKTTMSSSQKSLIVYTRTNGISSIRVESASGVEKVSTAQRGADIVVDGNSYSCHLLNGMKDGEYKYPFKGQLFFCKYYAGGKLVSDFVPVKSSTGKFGLYDLMTSNFYENWGVGNTLSGSTASYGDVNKRNYKRVEYISTTLDGKQYFDTGVHIITSSSKTYDFDLEVKSTDTRKDKSAILVSLNGRASTSEWAGTRNDCWTIDSDSQYSTNKSSLEKSKFHLKRTSTASTLTINDDTAGAVTLEGTVNGSNNLYEYTYLFANVGLDFCFVGNLYRCKIYENGNIIRDYVPVLDTAANLYGLYDLLDGSFNAGSYNFGGGPVVDNLQASLNFSYTDDEQNYTFENGINLTTQWSVPASIYNKENYIIKLGYEIGSNAEAFAEINKAKGVLTGENYVYQFSFKQIPVIDKDMLVKVTVYVLDNLNDEYAGNDRALYSLLLNNGNGYSVKSMAEKYVEMYNGGTGDTSYEEHIPVLKYLADIAE